MKKLLTVLCSALLLFPICSVSDEENENAEKINVESLELNKVNQSNDNIGIELYGGGWHKE